MILFDPRDNTRLYESHLPEARFKVKKVNGDFKLIREGLLESTSMVMSPVDILNPDYENFKIRRSQPIEMSC